MYTCNNIQESRTIATLGTSFTKKIKSHCALIIGCNGVGVETAKHLILNQIGQLYIYDQTKIEEYDKTVNFFIETNLTNLNQTRSEASIQQLRKLNSYSKVDLLSLEANNIVESIIEQVTIKHINTVIITNLKIFDLQNILVSINKLNKNLKELNCQLLICEDKGGFGYIWEINSNTDYTVEILKEKTSSEYQTLINQFIGEENDQKLQEIDSERRNQIKRAIVKSFLIENDGMEEIEMKILPDDMSSEKKEEYFKKIQQVQEWGELQTPTMSTLVGAYSAFQALQQSRSPQQFGEIIGFEYFKIIPEKRNKQLSVYEDFYASDFMKQFINSRILIPGCGALGCENIKLLTLFRNNGNQKYGKMIIIDFDLISYSNLNRQILFSNNDKDRGKAETACEYIMRNFPCINIASRQIKINSESEMKIGQQFWNQFDLVLNGLDNVDARSFIHSRCLINEIPFFEQGTSQMGGRCIPLIQNLSVTYDDIKPSQHAVVEEKSCTIKFYPTNSTHCLQWAREIFEERMLNVWQTAQNIKDGSFSERVKLALDSENHEEICEIKEQFTNFEKYFRHFKDFSFETSDQKMKNALQFSIQISNELFKELPIKILQEYPEDSLDESGQPRWKFPPKPIEYLESKFFGNLCNSVLNLVAAQYGIKDGLKIHEKEFNEMIGTVQINKISNEDQQVDLIYEKCENWKNQIQLSNNFSINFNFNPICIDLEIKENPSIIEFLHAIGNLRCQTYGIPESSFENTLKVGAKIEGQTSFTSSAIAAATINEIITYFKDKSRCQMIHLDISKNTFSMSDLPKPFIKADQDKVNIPKKFDSWYINKVNYPMTIRQLKQHLTIGINLRHRLMSVTARDYNIQLYMFMCTEENMDREILEIFEEEMQNEGKLIIDENLKYLIVDVSFSCAEKPINVAPILYML